MGERIFKRGEPRPGRAHRLPELSTWNDAPRTAYNRVANRLRRKAEPLVAGLLRVFRREAERPREARTGPGRQSQHAAPVETRREAQHGRIQGRHPRLHHVHASHHEQQVRLQHGDTAPRSHQLHLAQPDPQELAD